MILIFRIKTKDGQIKQCELSWDYFNQANSLNDSSEEYRDILKAIQDRNSLSQEDKLQWTDAVSAGKLYYKISKIAWHIEFEILENCPNLPKKAIPFLINKKPENNASLPFMMDNNPIMGSDLFFENIANFFEEDFWVLDAIEKGNAWFNLYLLQDDEVLPSNVIPVLNLPLTTRDICKRKHETIEQKIAYIKKIPEMTINILLFLIQNSPKIGRVFFTNPVFVLNLTGVMANAFPQKQSIPGYKKTLSSNEAMNIILQETSTYVSHSWIPESFMIFVQPNPYLMQPTTLHDFNNDLEKKLQTNPRHIPFLKEAFHEKSSLIVEAIKNKNIPLLSFLGKYQLFDFNTLQTQNSKSSLLMQSLINKKYDFFEFLVKNCRININHLFDKGTILTLIVLTPQMDTNSKLAAVKKAVQLGARIIPEIENKAKLNPVFNAVFKEPEMVNFFLKMKVKTILPTINLLAFSILETDRNVWVNLLKKGEDPNAASPNKSYKSIPLMAAAYKGNPDTFKTFLEFGLKKETIHTYFKDLVATTIINNHMKFIWTVVETIQNYSHLVEEIEAVFDFPELTGFKNKIDQFKLEVKNYLHFQNYYKEWEEKEFDDLAHYKVFQKVKTLVKKPGPGIYTDAFIQKLDFMEVDMDIDPMENQYLTWFLKDNSLLREENREVNEKPKKVGIKKNKRHESVKTEKEESNTEILLGFLFVMALLMFFYGQKVLHFINGKNNTKNNHIPNIKPRKSNTNLSNKEDEVNAILSNLLLGHLLDLNKPFRIHPNLLYIVPDSNEKKQLPGHVAITITSNFREKIIEQVNQALINWLPKGSWNRKDKIFDLTKLNSLDGFGNLAAFELTIKNIRKNCIENSPECTNFRLQQQIPVYLQSIEASKKELAEMKLTSRWKTIQEKYSKLDASYNRKDLSKPYSSLEHDVKKDYLKDLNQLITQFNNTKIRIEYNPGESNEVDPEINKMKEINSTLAQIKNNLKTAEEMLQKLENQKSPTVKIKSSEKRGVSQKSKTSASRNIPTYSNNVKTPVEREADNQILPESQPPIKATKSNQHDSIMQSESTGVLLLADKKVRFFEKSNTNTVEKPIKKVPGSLSQDSIKHDPVFKDIWLLLLDMENVIKDNLRPNLHPYASHYLLIKCSDLIRYLCYKDFTINIASPLPDKLRNLSDDLRNFRNNLVHHLTSFQGLKDKNLLQTFYDIFHQPFHELKSNKINNTNIDTLNLKKIIAGNEQYITKRTVLSCIEEIKELTDEAHTLHDIACKVEEKHQLPQDNILQCNMLSWIVRFRESIRFLKENKWNYYRRFSQHLDVDKFIEKGNHIAHGFLDSEENQSVSGKDYYSGYEYQPFELKGIIQLVNIKRNHINDLCGKLKTELAKPDLRETNDVHLSSAM